VNEAAQFEPRRTRLFLLGLLSIGVGAGCLLLVVVLLLLPFIAPQLPDPEAVEVDARSTAVNLLLLVSVAVVTVWLGVGSMLCRRWVRPLMLTLAWTWLICGIVVFPYSIMMSRAVVLTSLPDADPASPIVLVTRIFIGLMMGVIWLLLPLIFVWGYRHKDVQRTCESVNPAPAWTDRCPTAVLGLSVGLGGAAYVTLPTAVFAVLPLGPWLLTGWPAVVLTLLGTLLCAWLARATYRLRPAGWWGTLATIVILGVSFALTVLSYDIVDIYRAIGYPEHQLELFADLGAGIPPWALVVAVASFTVACIFYLLSIRAPFFDAAARSGAVD
jgi:hypothetical protein